MKCNITIKGFKLKVGFMESVKQYDTSGKVTGIILPGDKLEANFELEENSTDVQMSEHEFIKSKEIFEAGAKDVRDNAIIPITNKLFDLIDKIAPVVIASMALRNAPTEEQ